MPIIEGLTQAEEAAFRRLMKFCGGKYRSGYIPSFEPLSPYIALGYASSRANIASREVATTKPLAEAAREYAKAMRVFEVKGLGDPNCERCYKAAKQAEERLLKLCQEMFS